MRLPPPLVVAAGVVFVSTSAIIVRLSSAPALIIAAYRMWMTTVLLSPFAVSGMVRSRNGRAGLLHSPAAQATPETRAIPTGGATPTPDIEPAALKAPPVVLLSVASGVLLAMHFASWISSLSYASVASSTVIVTTHPIIVAVASFVILKERLTMTSLICMGAALAGGMVLVIGGFEEGGSQPLGYLLAFVGAVTVSGYMLIGRIVRQHMSARLYTFIVYGVSAVCLTAAAIVAGHPLFGYGLRELALFLALAIFCTLLGHSLFNWALRFMSPTVISTSILGEPVIASLLAVVIFREVPTVSTIAGGVVILVSIFFFIRESGRIRRAG